MTEQKSETRGAQKLKFPQDRFDDIPIGGGRDAKIGAHRAVPRPAFFGKWVLTVLVLTIIVSALGILWITQWSGGAAVADRVTAATKSEKVVAELDPEARVIVVNGTTVSELADSVAGEISNRDLGQVQFTDIAADSDVKISAVFYADDAYEGAAIALARELGGVSHYKSETYAEQPADLVVLLGSDYQGPGR
ncbi:LytR C-terminal domain-containing protein [Canibacter zhoujuaniae]|uniref:LytR C-terminal domain-containing protein n=1 Tax=Canibacter zhoujuaniae TaxID=2708343 RepID=UPI0014227DD8|nr:LytR C-terminal domain-containing protein [Canibacter zhoujuaniae]